MGAYDIQHELAAREKKRIAPMSVYRAVTFLVQSGRATPFAALTPLSPAPMPAVAPTQHDGDRRLFLFAPAVGK